nr:hypothetical protein [Tanacetum cinerariifolium]
ICLLRASHKSLAVSLLSMEMHSMRFQQVTLEQQQRRMGVRLDLDLLRYEEGVVEDQDFVVLVFLDIVYHIKHGDET